MLFKLSSAICFNSDQSKSLSSGNGLNNQKSTNCVTFKSQKLWKIKLRTYITVYQQYPLPDMPIFASLNSAANKDMMSKVWTNGDTII